jgi:lipopolysaccharide transport system ATP-binding protein
MSETVIQVDNLWKKYRLGVLGTGTLRHDFNRWWHRVRRKPDPYAKVGAGHEIEPKVQKLGNGNQNSNGNGFNHQLPTDDLSDDEMWALRGVSFEVKQGEILGIIGRNGAGKSTLLKILSRVTAPTSGEVRVKGRIASLLEVGTGFHPELTGRENIFLNGVILGMTKIEIKTKFDEIVAFSDVEDFIDTPVKRYSSGMYVRLAFAVAAHLDPEILIVDEVLAVGDQQFQKKCIGKMQDVSKGGRTVLFVSHQLTALQSLCTRGILLQKGMVHKIADISSCLETYLGDATHNHQGVVDMSTHAARQKTFFPTIRKVELMAHGITTSTVISGSKITVRLHIHAQFPIRQPRLAIAIEDKVGLRLFTTASYFAKEQIPDIATFALVSVTLPPLFLRPGEYLLSVSVADYYSGLIDSADGAIQFNVVWKDSLGNGENFHDVYGYQAIPCLWKTE